MNVKTPIKPNVRLTVGIGTTSPLGALDVENGGNTAKICLNGSCSTSLSASTPAVTVYNSGSGTYTTPTTATYLEIELCGGGGGGSGNSATNAGGSGGNTTFGSLTAHGGSGGSAGASPYPGGSGGTASGGNVQNLTGQAGGTTMPVAGASLALADLPRLEWGARLKIAKREMPEELVREGPGEGPPPPQLGELVAAREVMFGIFRPLRQQHTPIQSALGALEERHTIMQVALVGQG